jgi:hypothetical protein
MEHRDGVGESRPNELVKSDLDPGLRPQLGQCTKDGVDRAPPFRIASPMTEQDDRRRQ